MLCVGKAGGAIFNPMHPHLSVAISPQHTDFSAFDHILNPRLTPANTEILQLPAPVSAPANPIPATPWYSIPHSPNIATASCISPELKLTRSLLFYSSETHRSLVTRFLPLDALLQPPAFATPPVFDGPFRYHLLPKCRPSPCPPPCVPTLIRKLLCLTVYK